MNRLFILWIARLIFGILILFNQACTAPFDGGSTIEEDPASSTPGAPAANDFSFSFDQGNDSGSVALQYQSSGIPAESCVVENLLNASVSRACVCLNDVCTVQLSASQSFFGTGSFRFRIVDQMGRTSNSGVGTFNVTRVNQAPTIWSIPNQMILSDVPSWSIPILISDIDSSLSCTSSLVATSSDVTLVPVANIVISGTAPSCYINVTPVSGHTGTATIGMTVSDGALSSVANFDISVVANRPGPPAALLASNSGPGVTLLNWTASSGPGPITYNVYRSTQSGQNYAILPACASVASLNCIDNNIVPGTSYYYIVKASNLTSESVASNEAGLNALLPFGVSLAKTSITGGVGLAWTSPYIADPVTYSVYRSSIPGGPYTSVVSNLSSLNYFDSSAAIGQAYYYIIKTTVASGSVNSNELAATPMSSFSLSSLVLSGASSLNLSWTAASGATQYQILYGTESGNYANKISAGTNISQLVSGLSTGATYYFRVEARNLTDSLTTSNELAASLITPFTFVSGTSGNQSVTLVWNAAPGATSYDVIYDVTSHAGSTAVASDYPHTLTGQSPAGAVVTGLNVNTPYFFRIRANSINGSLLSTDEISVTTLPPPVSATYSTISAAASTVRSLQSIVITANLRDASNLPISGLPISGLSGVVFSLATGAGNSTGTFGTPSESSAGVYTVSFTGANPGAATQVSVRQGGTTVSRTVSVQVLAGTPIQFSVSGPPSMAANLCSTVIKLNFFDVNMNASTLEAQKSFNISGLGYGHFYSDVNCLTEVALPLVVSQGQSSSQDLYFKSLDPASYALGFAVVGGGLTQIGSAYGLTVTPVVNWLGAIGEILSSAAGNLHVAGVWDGTFNQVYGMSSATLGGSNYLFVADYGLSRVSKLAIDSSGNLSVVGSIGRLHWATKSQPTGQAPNAKAGIAANYCATLGPGIPINGAWCTGGQFQTGTETGSFNGPWRATVMTLSGTNYLFITDSGNHRIVRYNADTGEALGWSGRVNSVSGMTCPGGTVPTTGNTTPTWCYGGTSQASNTVVPGTTAAGNQFFNPRYLTNDGTYLYVIDYSNQRIVKIDPATGLLVQWMGRVAGNGAGQDGIDGMTVPTNISCLSSAQSEGSVLVARQFTPSWCVGGSATNVALQQNAFTNDKLNPQWISPTGISFYSDAAYNWMIVSDSGNHRINRYFCGVKTATPSCAIDSPVNIGGASYLPGQFFGWTGSLNTYSANMGPTGQTIAPTAIASLMTAQSGMSTGVATKGWAFYGNSRAEQTIGLYNNYAFTVANGYAYVPQGSGSNTVQKVNLTAVAAGQVSGQIVGWIGRINSTPTSGVSGCAGASSGTNTPGWCFGGNGAAGPTLGAFVTPYEVASVGNYLFVSDKDNFRITTHNVTTGAVINATGLKATLQTSGWLSGGLPLNSYPSNATLSTSITDRDAFMSYPDQHIIQGDYIYISDRGHHRIKRYKWLTGSFEGWIGFMSGTSPIGGDPNCAGAMTGSFTPGWCKGGASSSSASFGFYDPKGLASDGTYLYVADYSNARIVRIDLLTGAFKGWIGKVSTPPSDGEAGCSTTLVGDITPGWCIGGAAATSNLAGGYNGPSGLAGFTDTDNLYYLIVGDASNSRIVKVAVGNPKNAKWVGKNGSGSTVCAVANAVMVMSWCATGASGSNTDTTSMLNNGSVSSPTSIFVDTSTSPYYVYVTSNYSTTTANNGRVLRFNATTGEYKGWIGAINSITNISCGTPAPTTGAVTPTWCLGGSPNSNLIGSGVNGVYSDGTYLYVADSASLRILKYNRSTGALIGWKGKVQAVTGSFGNLAGGVGCSTAVANSITPDWCTGGTARGGFEISTSANGAAFDGVRSIWGNGLYLYVLDSLNGRLLQIPK
jgi:sugar lactone lactonase YvrE